jgi:hypothetical protein
MDLVTLVVACGLAAQSPIFVSFTPQPDCSLPAATGESAPLSAENEMVERWAAAIDAAAHRFGVSAQSIRAVMRLESGGVPWVTSPAGAMGLMQIMPATWTELRRRYGLGVDPYRPADNITGGVAYMRELLGRYGSPGFLAAYSAGPERVDDHLLTGRPLPDETRRYLAIVGPLLAADRALRRPIAADLPILGEIREREVRGSRLAETPRTSGLFVQLARKPIAIDEHSAMPSSSRSTFHRGAADCLGSARRMVCSSRTARTGADHDRSAGLQGAAQDRRRSAAEVVASDRSEADSKIKDGAAGRLDVGESRSFAVHGTVPRLR